MHEIRIATEKIEMLATLTDCPTAEKIWDALPIESTVNTYGQEIYFSIPIQDDLTAEARERMEVGELGYWPTGSAFCIFFGKTPASKSDEPRAASPVNPIGRVEGDVKVFRQVRDGETIVLEQIAEELQAPEGPPAPAAEEESPAEAPTETPGEAAEETAEETPEPEAEEATETAPEAEGEPPT